MRHNVIIETPTVYKTQEPVTPTLEIRFKISFLCLNDNCSVLFWYRIFIRTKELDASKIMLTKNGESGPPCFVRGSAFIFFTIKNDVC